MHKLLFSSSDLPEDIKKALADMGFEEATPIQSLAIPVARQGRDIIGQAQTGTGKTVAFGIPLLEKIDALQRHTQALVLCPTRELAIQVAEEFKRLAAYKRKIGIVPVYGGQPIERQLTALKRGAQVVVGTPGRVMDHLERGTIRLDRLGTLVLDEADEMLDMGFIDDIETILKTIPAERQTLLFAATMPAPILAITRRYQKDPQLLSLVHEQLTVPLIEQAYVEVREQQ
jgi:ATP-dependent RNA helicase DeaD